ncbi:MAG: lipoate--protein ligase family protein, partial [Planctomycetota bacterium]
MQPCRLIVDPPQPGARNMAVDEALLDAAAAGAGATLRLYRWSSPTLSLGYFQPLAARAAHPASAGCPCVRRHSGGGAIVHDHELTYSLAVP